MKTKFLLGAAAVFASLASIAAHADPITSSMSITYYQVADGSDPDFNVNTTPTVAAGSGLGPNGLPLGSGVNDISGGQITWWSPLLNSHVTQTGTGTINLPYASNMFAPNSTGSNNAQQFETAVLTGTFNLAGTGDLDFHLGSDDDTFVYVDGILVGQNPGVHGITNVAFSATGLAAGDHTLQIFYADRQNTEARLTLSIDSDVTITPPDTGAPEPATLALVGAGLAGISRLRKRKTA